MRYDNRKKELLLHVQHRTPFISQTKQFCPGIVVSFRKMGTHKNLNCNGIYFFQYTCPLGDLLIFADKVRSVCLTFFQKYYYIVIKNSCLYCHIYELARQKHIWFLKIEFKKINIKKFCQSIWLAAFLKLPYKTGVSFLKNIWHVWPDI